MNDLSKKEETRTEETRASKKEVSASSGLLRKKLENFLLLYYQAYLKGETAIEPDIRTVFFKMVKRDQDFAFKVRILQLDYLQLENGKLEGEWNEATEELFPKVDQLENPVDEDREKTLLQYKQTLLELLISSGELGSQAQ